MALIVPISCCRSNVAINKELIMIKDAITNKTKTKEKENDLQSRCHLTHQFH